MAGISGLQKKLELVLALGGALGGYLEAGLGLELPLGPLGSDLLFVQILFFFFLPVSLQPFNI